MKKTLSILGWLFLLFLLSACGLDTFYYLNPPISKEFIDEADSISNDPSNQFVSFATSMNSENREIFQGTSVYYKIYNSPTQLLSHKTTIEDIDTEYSDQGIGRLNGWGYQSLTTTKLTTANLVSASDSVKEVYIRLSNQTEDPPSSGIYMYPADVTIDGASIGIPLRSVDNKTFSFSATADDDSPYSVPREGEEDVYFTADAGTSTWYVALYAVSTGMSPSLTPVYSQVTYLGSLAINPT